MYPDSTKSSTTNSRLPEKDLTAFGKKLKRLRQAAGLSQQALVDRLTALHARSDPGLLPVEPQLISKWETAYSYKGRQWSPARAYTLYLIETFADYLTGEEARRWAALAGHKIVAGDLETIFPPELDWPPLQAPQLPAYHVRRRHLERLILAEINKKQVQSLILWGPGGVGKTTLAVWLTKLLAAGFPDGVIWVPVQAGDTVIDIQDAIADSLGLTLNEADSTKKRARKLHSRLRKKRCLVVFDDIPALPDLADLGLGSETCRLLGTTRDAKTAQLLEAAAIPIGGLTEEEGLDLLAQWAGHSVEAEELVTRLGGLPLALKLAGGQLRAGLSLDDLISAFREEQVDLSLLEMDDPQSQAESLTLCFDLSYRSLSATVRQRFVQLGYFQGRHIEEAAIQAVWGIDSREAGHTLRRLLRFALIERSGRAYSLHPLLRDYACQKRTGAPLGDKATRRRHALWHIRHALYHPGLISNHSEEAPDLEQSWADVVASVAWAVRHDPPLAGRAAFLAYTDRPALLEAIGPSLIQAVETCLAEMTDRVEQVVWRELLGDFYLLQGSFKDGLTHFEQAAGLWQSLENGLAACRAQLRAAGACLLRQEQAAAAEAARQAQALLRRSLPLSAGDKRQADQLFYWFDMIYNPLVRWADLPEADVIALTDLANQTNEPVLQARSLHIHRLWCTTGAVSRSPEVRQKGRGLALEAYALWRAGDRKDRADDEISLTNYFLTGRYSRRTAVRFARRRSQTTPPASPSQTDLIHNEGIRWWLAATETQRVAWLSWMLPRYLGATNRPDHPARGTQLPVLKPRQPAFRFVENILSIGALGSKGRRLPVKSPWPSNHILREPEWRVLSGQRVFPVVDDKVEALVSSYLAWLEAGLRI